MKKLLLVVLAIALLIVPMSIAASAETSVEDLKNEALENLGASVAEGGASINDFEALIIKALDENVVVADGRTFHIPDEYITQAENYLKTHEVDEEAYNLISEEIEASKQLIADSGITSTSNLKVLSAEKKDQLLASGKKAAAAVDAVLTYNGETVVVKNTEGETVFNDEPVIKVTGAEADFTATLLSVAGVVALLTAAAVVASKKGLLSK